MYNLCKIYRISLVLSKPDNHLEQNIIAAKESWSLMDYRTTRVLDKHVSDA